MTKSHSEPQLTMDDIDDAVAASTPIEPLPAAPEPVIEPIKTSELATVEYTLPERGSTVVTPREIAENLEAWKALALACSAGLDNPIKTAALTFQKLFIGAGMGLTTTASLTGMHIIQGVPSLTAHTLAGVARAHGWDFTVEESEPPGTWCKITANKGGMTPVVFQYTIDMANQQGLVKSGGAYDKHPWNMLYARCMAVVCRRACPEALSGVVAVGEPIDAHEDSTASGGSLKKRVNVSD